jgi:hypothetical protein
MGLLPAEHLLEPPAGATRDPPKAVPAVPPKTIAAAGEIVTGMRIGGEAQGVTEDEILVENEGFEFVPTALRLGFPLMVKKLQDAQDSTGETLDYKLRIYIYELMKTPGLGLPITWNANGATSSAPHHARSGAAHCTQAGRRVRLAHAPMTSSAPTQATRPFCRLCTLFGRTGYHLGSRVCARAIEPDDAALRSC